MKPLCNFPVSESLESDVCSTCYWRFCISFEGVYLLSMLSDSRSKTVLIVSEIILSYYSTYFEYSTTTTIHYYYIFLCNFWWSCRPLMKFYKHCFHLKCRWKCWRKLVVVEIRIKLIWKVKFKLCSRFHILLKLLSKLKYK